jgi:TPR repeat protein
MLNRYSEAAESGDADAEFALGVAFAKGRGVPKSHQQVKRRVRGV